MFLLDLIRKWFKKEYGTGLLEDPIDYRDISMSAVSKKESPLPESYTIPYVLGVKKQGSDPICVGCSTSSLKENKERIEGNFIDFDAWWLYSECKKSDGMPDYPGTYFRSGLKVLQKIGCKPVDGVVSDEYRIGGYIRVPCDYKSLKRAIYEFGGVLIGFKGSNKGWKSAYIRPPKSGEHQWGHAVYAVGYDKEYITIQNSWGKHWGKKGYGYFNEKYLPFSAWAIVNDLPNNWKELLKKPEKPKYEFINNLYKGLQNEEVKILQDCLNYLGCMNYKSTGYFGSLTFQAVKNFQIRYNIFPRSGFVGPLTREKLNNQFNK